MKIEISKVLSILAELVHEREEDLREDYSGEFDDLLCEFTNKLMEEKRSD